MGHLKEFLLLHIIECVHQLPIGLLGYNGDALFNWNVLLYQCHHQMSKYHWEMLVRGASARCILLKIPGKFSTNYFSLNTENMDLILSKSGRGGAAYLYLISILIWLHFDTYPYISIQNILMRAQNILIIKIYLWGGFLWENIQMGDPWKNVFFSFHIWNVMENS